MDNKKILPLMFVMAFSIMVYEILGTSVLFHFYEQSSKSVAIVVGVFMVGLAIASYISSKTKINLIYINLIAGLFGLLFYSRYNLLENLTQIIPSKLIISILCLLPMAILLGLNYPLLHRKYKEKENEVYTVDLVGASFGVIISGFVLVPIFGIKLSFILVSLLVLVSNIIMLITSKKSFVNKLVISSIIILIIILNFMPIKTMTKTNIEQPKQILYQSEYGEVKVIFEANSIPYEGIEHDESIYGPGLYINTRLECITYSSYSEKMMSVRTLREFDNDNLEVLNIGLGCGFTAQHILKSDKVKSLDIVEINKVIPIVNRKYFSEYNNNVLDNPKTNLIIQDGFQYLKTNTKKYDIIIIDVESFDAVHSTPIFTLEMFQLINDSLKEDGVFTLWIDDGYFSSIYLTLSKVYDNVIYLDEPLSYQPEMTMYSSNRKLNLESSDLIIDNNAKIITLDGVLI